MHGFISEAQTLVVISSHGQQKEYAHHTKEHKSLSPNTGQKSRRLILNEFLCDTTCLQLKEDHPPSHQPSSHYDNKWQIRSCHFTTPDFACAQPLLPSYHDRPFQARILHSGVGPWVRNQAPSCGFTRPAVP